MAHPNLAFIGNIFQQASSFEHCNKARPLSRLLLFLLLPPIVLLSVVRHSKCQARAAFGNKVLHILHRVHYLHLPKKRGERKIIPFSWVQRKWFIMRDDFAIDIASLTARAS
jgi:hypothetical protein